MNPQIGPKVVECESLGCVRWLSVKPLNCVLESLLGAVKVLLRATKPPIEAQQRVPAMTTK